MVNDEVPQEMQVAGGLSEPVAAPAVGAVAGEVLSMLTKEFLTPRQIAIRRKTSRQAVDKVILKLRRKGLIGITGRGVAEGGVAKQPPSTPPSHGIRLHGEVYRVELPPGQDLEAYHRRLGRGVLRLVIDGNTVLCYPKCLVVYGGVSFVGESAELATAKACLYWNRFFAILENDLRLILLKPRLQNVRRTRGEYERLDGAIGAQAEAVGERIKLMTNDDGRLWFVADRSLGYQSGETVHRQTAEVDMEEVVGPHLNDWRDNRPPLNSELAGHIERLAVIQGKELDKWGFYAEQIVAHVGAIQELSKGVKEFRKAVRQLNKEAFVASMDASQRKLMRWLK